MPAKLTDFEILRHQLERAGLNQYQGGSENPRPKCAVFNQIGQLALDGDLDALRFVTDNLKNPDRFIRYAAVGFLGDMPIKHLESAGVNAMQKIGLLIRADDDKKILDFARESLRKIKNKKSNP